MLQSQFKGSEFPPTTPSTLLIRKAEQKDQDLPFYVLTKMSKEGNFPCMMEVWRLSNKFSISSDIRGHSTFILQFGENNTLFQQV